ncbi:MAG TPA: MFS transporter [Clostridiaceae bacterium]|nr:MFS transporter [Clostridiaceae bacterium]
MLCWTAYTFAYLGRINLSVALPMMDASLPSVDKSKLGIIGSLFFWTYAFGQLINGKLGDRFSGRSFIFTGLIISALMNLLFSFSDNLILMYVFWAINGYFQAMLWGPLMRILNRWFSKEKKYKMALYIFSSVVGGFLLTWGVIGQISAYAGWRSVFWIPGIVILLYSVIWYLFARNSPEEVGLNVETGLSVEDPGLASEDSEPKDGLKAKDISFIKFLLHSKLYLVALSGIPLGFIREGISLWGPTMLFETFGLDLQSTMGSVLLIPFFNFVGVVAARLLITKFIQREANLGALFFAGGTITCALMYLSKDFSLLIFLFMLAACSMSLYGATSILTSVIPMKYNLTSSIAGFLDFSIYLGAGISGVVSGFLSNEFGWGIMALIWTIVGVAGIVCIYLAGINETTLKRMKRKEEFINLR